MSYPKNEKKNLLSPHSAVAAIPNGARVYFLIIIYVAYAGLFLHLLFLYYILVFVVLGIYAFSRLTIKIYVCLQLYIWLYIKWNC